MKIKNIRFTYIDCKYGLGPFVDFVGELEVPSIEYDDVVGVLKEKYPEFDNIKVMSFNRY